jgi:hypothetical protein
MTWSSVTFQSGRMAPERQIFFAEDAPRMEALRCADDAVQIVGPDTSFALGRVDMAAFTRNPLAFRRHQRLPSPPRSAWRRVTIWLGGLLLALGVFGFLWKRGHAKTPSTR